MNTFQRIHFIVNPVSGRFGSRRIVEQLRQKLAATGAEICLRRTEAAGDSRRFAMEAGIQGADLLIIVGGDGTVSEAADGLVGDFDKSAGNPEIGGNSVPILLVPMGTENLLARYLGIRANPAALWEVFQTSRLVTLDAGVVNDRTFLMVAGIGFDAHVVRRLHAARRGHISYSSYFGPLWRTFWSYRQPQVFVEADGAQVFAGRGLVFVGNIPRYAIGLRLLHHADPTDGMLDLCIFETSWQGPLLRHSLNVLFRRHIGSRGVIYRQASKVAVRSGQGAIDLELDGDLAGSLPVEFAIRPGALRFMVPRDWRP